MIRIIHIITGLNNGGAEMMLYKLLENIDKSKYKIEVISMMDKGIMGPKIENLGINVHTLDMKQGIPSIKSILKARKICSDADFIQSWMYHADLFSFIIGKIFMNKKVIWGIRRANLEKGKNKKSLLMIAKINSFLSKFVNEIVSCSIEAKKTHIDYGFKESKIVVIPNGFSIEKYSYNSEAKKKLLKELGINENKTILSVVGRWNILKDHKNALDSLVLLKEKYSNLIMIFAGTGMKKNNKELIDLIKERNLGNEIYLLGRREDIPDIMSATDIYVSSSSGEGFPNVIGEAMACETPCVVTNVGDSAYIVGETGIVVPRQKPKQLANGIEKLLKLDLEKREELVKFARQRIVDNFEVSKVVEMYTKLYK